MSDEELEYDVEQAVSSFDRKCRGIKTPLSSSDALDLEMKLQGRSDFAEEYDDLVDHEEEVLEPRLPFLQQPGASVHSPGRIHNNTALGLSSSDGQGGSPKINLKYSIPSRLTPRGVTYGEPREPREQSRVLRERILPSSPLRTPRTSKRTNEDYSYVHVPMPAQDANYPAVNPKSKQATQPSHAPREKLQPTGSRRWVQKVREFLVKVIPYLVALMAIGGIGYASMHVYQAPTLARPQPQFAELQYEVSELRREVYGLREELDRLADHQPEAEPAPVPISSEEPSKSNTDPSGSAREGMPNYKWNWASAVAGAQVGGYSNSLVQAPWWARALARLRPSTDGSPGSLIGTTPGKLVVENAGYTLRMTLAEPAHLQSVVVTADDPVKIVIAGAPKVYDAELQQWNDTFLYKTLATGYNKVDIDAVLHRFNIVIKPEMVTTVRSVAAYGRPPAAS